MQEIVLLLSSLAGVATAVAVRKMPRNKGQLLNMGASSHIKSQINTLKIEEDILTKTITRLYQAESEFSKIQKDRLLLKYQRQLGIVLARLEKLEQASRHPDLGPVGDGLITLMDQKLSKLDDRLYELSSKMAGAKINTPKEEPKQSTSKPFNFEIPRETKPIRTPQSSRQSFELTTLTNISKKRSRFPSATDKEQGIVNPMPQPATVHTEIIKSKQEIIQETIQPKQDKIETVQPTIQSRPDIDKEVAKITKYKALPEQKPVTLDDDFDDDTDLDEIKGNITRILSKLDQAEVE